MSHVSHRVMPGECLSSIAALYGTTTAELWSDPENAPLRERSGGPNVLSPGEVVVVRRPAPSPGATVSPGAPHRFRGGAAETVRLRLRLVAHEWDDSPIQGRVEGTGARVEVSEPPEPEMAPDRPLANVAFRLAFGGREVRGETDGDGKIDVPIDAQIKLARLTLEPDTLHERTIDLKIGYLEPIDSPSGVRQRLNNLGFSPGELGDEADIKEAARMFQRKHGLSPTGELDDATRAKLRDAGGA